MKHWYLLGAVLAALLLAGLGLSPRWRFGLVQAWWVIGHGSIAEAAADGLPADMPAFFRAAGKQLNHLAGDPDRWKNPSCKHLRAAEAPDHFIDLEHFGDNPLPPDRWKAIALLQKLKKNPEFTGMLPWAIMENYDRLSVAFYDLRAEPDNPAVRAKCIVYAGILSHLTGDCVMPLHTTKNYDGRPDKDGTLLQKGIHAKIDAFPERHGLTAEAIGRSLKANKLDDVWKHVVEQIHASHKLVPRCYDLDRAGAFDKPTRESRDFILERCRTGAQFTMDLWCTAWHRSAGMPKHY
jgi:hypothetical protein